VVAVADLLSHVLLAFALFTTLGWAVSWLDRRWVAVGMVGSILPDLDMIELVLEAHAISQATGVPLDWEAIHTLGGVLLLAGVGALLFEERDLQRRAFALLVAGGVSHLVFDGVKAWADGANGASLYPFSWWRNPTPGWYVSSDWGVVVIATVVAGGVWIADRYLVPALNQELSATDR
jgi:membrane-bound metal-dependent hydrolase YbcI (DUF457 family)